MLEVGDDQEKNLNSPEENNPDGTDVSSTGLHKNDEIIGN